MTATATTNLTELDVRGMTCGNCVRHATEALQGVAGVASAAVTLDPGRAVVRWKSETTPATALLVEALGKAGFEGRISQTDDSKGTKRSFLDGWQFNVIVGAAVTVPLLIGEWFLHWGMERWFQWVSFFLALGVQVACGARFYRGAWMQLKSGSSNMDTLVSLGSTTAFAYSAWAFFAGWPGHLYFMEAAAIITLISAGHWMEQRISERAAGSLRALLNLAPDTARRVDAMGNEKEVPVSALRIGDRVVLKPGDRVATDGEVVAGAGAVDETMLTGESLPVDKAKGAALYAGTVNQNGRLVMRVTATGEATALAHIIEVVRHAQTSRAQIQKLADQVSNVFVPVVVVIAVATALWWGFGFAQASATARALTGWLWPVAIPPTALAAAVIHAAAVLIVACPCAMGLATPAAIMAGANAAASRGILIRDGSALEKSGTITAVVFDKTGTLTEGRPKVLAQEILPGRSRLVAPKLGEGGGNEALNSPIESEIGLDPTQTIQLASSLARASNHPISRAIAELSPGTPIPFTHFEEHRGSGVAARLKSPDHLFPPANPDRGFISRPRVASPRATLGNVPENPPDPEGVESIAESTIRLGALTWLRECGVDTDPAKTFQEKWSAQGATVIGLATGSQLIALFALADSLKPRSAEVVARLQRQGKTVYLITGDNARTAAAIATQAGIPSKNVFAEVRPEDKAKLLQQLQSKGERVAFVGDGINDAPALEQADLGIAVSRASDVAREAADIILLRSDIEAIPQALGLAQATLRTIKQNLFWAFFYNAAAVPLAALGFLSPILCAAAMGLSDVVVIGNALRLRSWKDDP